MTLLRAVQLAQLAGELAAATLGWLLVGGLLMVVWKVRRWLHDPTD